MAIYVYNTKQQELNSKKLAELISFSSNDFSGLISNIQDPIVIESDEWRWNVSLQNTLVDFMGGGVDIGYDIPTDSYSFTQQGCSVYGLVITVPSVTSNPTTNVYNTENAYLAEIPCSNIEVKDLFIMVSNPIGDPSQKNYYEYSNTGNYILSSDTSVDLSKVYYYKISNESFKVTDAEFDSSTTISFEYFGNTVWVNKSSGKFFIPFCGKIDNGEYISMIFNRDKAGYESFLSARTYYNLLMELGNKFVFRSGGEKLGDIGQLNITDNKITNQADPTSGVSIDKPIFSGVEISNEPADLNRLVLLNDTSGLVYKTNDKYIIPIKHGGTSAGEKDKARENLGFYVGPDDPNVIGKVPLKTDSTKDINAIYFKIL